MNEDNKKYNIFVFGIIILLAVVLYGVLASYTATISDSRDISSTVSNTSYNSLLLNYNSQSNIPFPSSRSNYNLDSFSSRSNNMTWLDFDGINDYINISNSASLNPSQISISVWFKTSLNITQVILGKHYSSSYYINVGNWGVGLWTNGTSLASGATNLDDGKWHQVVGICNGSYQWLYVDGAYSNSQAGTLGTDMYDLLIGMRDTGTMYFNGSIDEIRLYNRTLSQAEITQLYTNNRYENPNLVSSGLVAYYPFNENQGTTLYDIVGGHNGI